ncbi:hypothetical protein [Streptomyces griseosporeus]|uniref:hypothetical protein n=1 Tax=Streptomyces griseosporeus TaxID=1910 RepID=UPI00167E0234|nr:hypothetical protein [Streptomyces griseosporeus]GHF85060.1 hypothetical protein GCM10018783_64200 [Streptomyces griseosporeus]
MTWPTALPGAAARVLRAVAGRRALQVALMVGAFFALGFLCGEKAQAAETATPAVPAVTVPTVTVPTVTVPGVSDAVRPPAEHAPAEDVVRPVAERTVTSVRERVVRPAGEVVESVTAATSQLPELPSAPALPNVPDLPSAPALPQLPDLPSVPDVPSVSDLPALPAPVPTTAAPHPAAPASAVAPATAAPAAARTAPAAAPDAMPTPARTGDFHATPAEHAAAPHRRAARTSNPSRLPAPHAPESNLGSSASGDAGSSRHGDAHAVTPCPRLPVRLAAGAVARSGAAGIRDRYRDIPVFPA